MAPLFFVMMLVAQLPQFHHYHPQMSKKSGLCRFISPVLLQLKNMFPQETVIWCNIMICLHINQSQLLELPFAAPKNQLEMFFCNSWVEPKHSSLKYATCEQPILDFSIKFFVFPYFGWFLGGTLSRISACEVCNLWAAFPFPFKTLKLQNGRRPVSTEVGNFGAGGFLIFPVFSQTDLVLLAQCGCANGFLLETE